MAESETSSVVVRTCIDCRGSFRMTANEVAWYRTRRLHQPRRCPACRKARRAASEAEERAETERAAGDVGRSA
jgi:hypothetical protein